MVRMNFLSLFAGIGGFDLGLERAGMQCVGQVEIDQKCQLVLAKHWPNVKRIGDIRDVTADTFGPVDLICGGFPCQPFSTAGKRKGKEDNRFLWPEMVRVIAAYRPAWVLGENVAGIISLALDQVHSDLEGIGYQVQSFIIPACAVDAPHRRDRVWIVAHAQGCNDRRGAGEIQGSDEQQKAERPKERVCTPCYAGENVPNSQSIGSQRQWSGREQKSGIHGIEELSMCISSDYAVWPIEPELGRVAHGIPNRMDRLKQLGNAVVPQVVEEIGKAILRSHVLCEESPAQNTMEICHTAPNT